MNRQDSYPLGTWVLLVMGVPVALMVIGIALAAATFIGDLPYDNADLWWIGGVVPLAGLMALHGVTRRRRALVRFTSSSLAPLLTARLSPNKQAIRAGLVMLALLLLVVGILGPRWGIYLEKQKVRGVDIVVAVDVSRSMLARDLAPNRLERAKQAIRQQLIERAVFRQANRLALIAFAGTTSLKVPLTTDHLAFRRQLEGLSPGSAPRGGTAISTAIRRASDLFAQSTEEATKIILLFTDGEDHEGDAVAAAHEAYEASGIKVFTIGVGDPSRTVGAEVPSADESGKPLLHDGQIVFSKLDVAGLQEIAAAVGGRYAPLEDFHALVQAIAGMWKVELSVEERQRHRPRYQWFIAGTLLLLVIESITTDRRSVSADAPRRLWQESSE